MTENNTYLKDTAIALAKSGIKVFPCHSVQEGKCSCEKIDCKNPGKHPRLHDGILGATTNESYVEVWWASDLPWHNSNIGALIVWSSGYLVLDSEGNGEEYTCSLE